MPAEGANFQDVQSQLHLQRQLPQHMQCGNHFEDGRVGNSTRQSDIKTAWQPHASQAVLPGLDTSQAVLAWSLRPFKQHTLDLPVMRPSLALVEFVPNTLVVA